MDDEPDMPWIVSRSAYIEAAHNFREEKTRELAYTTQECAVIAIGLRILQQPKIKKEERERLFEERVSDIKDLKESSKRDLAAIDKLRRNGGWTVDENSTLQKGGLPFLAIDGPLYDKLLELMKTSERIANLIRNAKKAPSKPGILSLRIQKAIADELKTKYAVPKPFIQLALNREKCNELTNKQKKNELVEATPGPHLPSTRRTL